MSSQDSDELTEFEEDSYEEDSDENEVLPSVCKKCGEEYHKWCKPCRQSYLKENFTNWTSENEKIDDFIQEMQLNDDDIIFEWILYNQFDNIKEIEKNNNDNSTSNSVYSAIWKDGPLCYDDDKKKLMRESNEEVTLRCLRNSKNNIDKFLIEVKSYINDEDIGIYGLSQDPDTKDYIMILQDFYCQFYCKECGKKKYWRILVQNMPNKSFYKKIYRLDQWR
ncbi:hypothetical protein C1645_583129 [Glomus cerebriforme]|uniref:Uncharacterized protein n=1 Tax=Glomus cerebriforme TaxID=658196 RepID=A0A397TH04_9GLOM|nr:hypothetical protein C1645_583129 [Glomus cerebriforme]